MKEIPTDRIRREIIKLSVNAFMVKIKKANTVK